MQAIPYLCDRLHSEALTRILLLILYRVMHPSTSSPQGSFADSKPHYPLLDGLRGVAAIVVVWYHIFESFATSHLDQVVNHGYLAVDFFFLLSGFVHELRS